MAFVFRRLERTDFGLLATWLAEPSVRRWWNHETTPEAVDRDFGPRADGNDPGEDHVVLLDGRPIGLIQLLRYAEEDAYRDELTAVVEVPDDAVGIDYLIGEPSVAGRGVGTAMLGAFSGRIWLTEPEASCIVVAVNAANIASWRALEKAGYVIVASGDLEPDNPVDPPLHHILRLDRPSGG